MNSSDVGAFPSSVSGGVYYPDSVGHEVEPSSKAGRVWDFIKECIVVDVS